MEGRIAASAINEAWSANISWEHQPTQDQVSLSGPLGQGAVSIIVRDGQVYVDEGKGEVSSSLNSDEFLRDRLGFSVPLQSLRYWVLGAPAPNAEYKPILDASGGLQGFEQQAWLMRIDSFEAVGDLILPRKMIVRGKEAALKLIADEWVVGK